MCNKGITQKKKKNLHETTKLLKFDNIFSNQILNPNLKKKKKKNTLLHLFFFNYLMDYESIRHHRFRLYF